MKKEVEVEGYVVTAHENPDSKFESLEEAKKFALDLAEQLAKKYGGNPENISFYINKESEMGYCPYGDDEAQYPHIKQIVPKMTASYLIRNGWGRGIDLRGMDFSNEDFKNANLQRLYLQKINLQGANLQGANLQGAKFQAANLEGADLRSVNLQCANFQAANLEGANLEGADLQGANFQNANLEGVNFQGANLRGANLDYACWPLWCGSKGVHVDKRIFCQLVAHLCAVVIDDEEAQEAQEYLLKLAKQSHRFKNLGTNKGLCDL